MDKLNTGRYVEEDGIVQQMETVSFVKEEHIQIPLKQVVALNALRVDIEIH